MRTYWVLFGLILCVIFLWLYDYNGQTYLPRSDTQNVENSLDSNSNLSYLEKANDYAFAFEYAKFKLQLGSKFNDFRDSLIASLQSDRRLEILGLYHKEERNTSKLENLGLARANALKHILQEKIDPSQIMVNSKQLASTDSPVVRPRRMIRLSLKIKTDRIDEILDRTLIYFPLNSTRRLDDDEVESYLNDVASRVKKSDERVQLIGHTDSYGQASKNYELGLSRARVIRNYLIQRGVSKNKIIVDSKGETNPIASNNTEEGRSRNRRTELIIGQ